MKGIEFIKFASRTLLMRWHLPISQSRDRHLMTNQKNTEGNLASRLQPLLESKAKSLMLAPLHDRVLCDS
jgi:hypothetical protein